MMKRLLIIVLVGWAGLARANDSIVLEIDTLPQAVLITDSMPNVTVIQDAAITGLLYDKARGSCRQAEIPGYRVQIFSSNHQQIAKNEAIKLEQEMAKYTDLPIYVTYVSPFWKVRIGDFLTYEEANEYKRIFIAQHPELTGDTYVVRDQVKTNQ